MASNIPAAEDTDKSIWPAAGARVSPDDLLEIDKARVHGGYSNRSELIVKAVFDRVRSILGSERLSDAERLGSAEQKAS